MISSINGAEKFYCWCAGKLATVNYNGITSSASISPLHKEFIKKEMKKIFVTKKLFFNFWI